MKKIRIHECHVDNVKHFRYSQAFNRLLQRVFTIQYLVNIFWRYLKK